MIWSVNVMSIQLPLRKNTVGTLWASVHQQRRLPRVIKLAREITAAALAVDLSSAMQFLSALDGSGEKNLINLRSSFFDLCTACSPRVTVVIQRRKIHGY